MSTLVLCACGGGASDPTDAVLDADASSDPGAEVDDDATDVAGDGDASPRDTDASDGVGDAADVEPDTLPPYEPLPEVDLLGYVDPFIGTDGPGNTVPGALVPHGVVRASPVTNSGGGAIDAYEHGDGAFFGFAHMHLEGPGGSANGYGHVVLTPYVGALEQAPTRAALGLDPERERAAPGWYAVSFDAAALGLDGEQGIVTEVSASQWAAAHRYTFSGVSPGVVLDLGESRGRSIGGSIAAAGPGVFEGTARYDVHPGVSGLIGDGRTARIEVSWSLRFDPPPARWATWKGSDAPTTEERTGRELALVAVWDEGVTEVDARIGLSLVDPATAAEHRDALAQTFDEVRDAAAAAWNTRLNRVRAEGSDEDLTRFYTALYHAMFQPADYSEGDVFVTAWDGERHVHPLPEGRRYYTDDWCFWDTYRTSHPLRTLVEPDIVDDMVWSLLHAYQEGGWLPKCPWAAAGYSRVMTGNPQVAIIADAIVKGFDGFDRALALEAVRNTSERDSNPFPEGLCGYFGLGTPPEYVERGYVSHQCDPTQSASLTMELAYADWTVARMAEVLGEPELAEAYQQRSRNWRRHWDESVRFPRGVNRDGSWVEPFDPASMADTNDFVEASAWIFSFFVPHDVPSLIEVHGGEDAFAARLDEFFEAGHYDPSNQPSFHIPFLYAEVGEHDAARGRVRAIMDRHFGSARDGLPGNDDAGSTSAWYVLAALGIYPMAPGSPEYTVTGPTLRRAQLVPPAGWRSRGFTFEVHGEGPNVVSAELDGVPLQTPELEDGSLRSGGTLRIGLGEARGTWTRDR